LRQLQYCAVILDEAGDAEQDRRNGASSANPEMQLAD
jgi:hypothetical protein